VLLMAEKTRALTLTGILSGFIVLCLYAQSIAPTGRAGFLVLASFLVGAIFLLGGWRWARGGLVVSLTISFFLVPDKLGLVPFALLFGPYPLLKNLVERLNRVWLDWVLKLAGFGLLVGVGYALFSPLVPERLRPGAAPVVVVLALVVGFVVYDLLYTGWIQFFLLRVKPKLRRGGMS
jgi:hypothetical protein